MSLLPLLPWLAFLAALGATLAFAWRLRAPPDQPARRWAGRLLAAAAGLAILDFLILVWLFIDLRVGIEYVFLYTADFVPLRYRIAGAWAGREGSLALWAAYTAIVGYAVVWWHGRRSAKDPAEIQARAWTELGLAALATAFLGAVAASDLFAPTAEFLLQNRPQGNGLNPTLMSPFILIHPPVMFLAYAMTGIPLAAVLAHLVTGTDRWSRVGLTWSRIDWAFYTFAMGLGGIWAYYTLGFGGYWAWDPVEVANLLPWLALTLFLHAQLHHLRHGSYRAVGPLLGVLPFLLTVFSTISTRSGLWVSVHAFTDPTQTFDPDAQARFLAILAKEPGLSFHAGIFLAVLLLFLALWARRMAADHGRMHTAMRSVGALFGAMAAAAALAPQTTLSLIFDAARVLAAGRTGTGLLVLTAAAFIAPALPALVHSGEADRRPWLRRIDLRSLAFLSILTLGMGLLVLFLFHMAATSGWSEAFYLDRFPALATPVLVGLLLFMAIGLQPRRRALALVGVVVAVAAVAGLTRGAPTYLLVLTVALVATAAARVHAAGVPRNVPRDLQLARLALWLAAVLDVVFWLNPPAIDLGFVWRPVWPAQLFFGALAFLALHLATRALAGDARSPAATHLLVGALGGFYVAPFLAAASWLVHGRHTAVSESNPRRRMHQASLYTMHFAVALLLLGYTVSTYYGTEDRTRMSLDEQVDLSAAQATYIGTAMEADGGQIDRILPRFVVEHGGSQATVEGILYWEPQTASHYPLPATARFWDRDVYVAVDGVCVDPTGECTAEQDWIQAYEPGGRLPAGIQVTGVQVQLFDLPGLGLVWAGLFVLLYALLGLVAYGPERP